MSHVNLAQTKVIAAFVVLLTILAVCSGCGRAAYAIIRWLNEQPPARFESLEPTTSWVDSREVVYFFYPEEDGRGDTLWSVRLDGTECHKLLDAPVFEFALAPDGKRIAYRQNYSKRAGLIDLETGSDKTIAEVCNSIGWRSDSQAIAYYREAPMPAGRLCVYDIQSGTHREVPMEVGESLSFCWRRDQTQLYVKKLGRFYALRTKDWTVELLGVTPKGVHWWDQFGGIGAMHFDQSNQVNDMWSKARSPSGTRRLESVNGSLLVRQADGSQERMLLENTGGYSKDFGPRGFENPRWTSDERYALGEVGLNVVVVEIATGRAGVLVDRGHHPITYRPGYHPGADCRVNPMSSFAALAGYP